MRNALIARILEELRLERQKIDEAITTLSSLDGKLRLKVTSTFPIPMPNSNGRRPMSRQRRQALSQTMRAVWAKKRRK